MVNPECKHRHSLVSTRQPNAPLRLYNTTLRSIMPLPNPNAPPNSAPHQNAYPVFPVGATVMVLYPDTSCFYRAEVLASPSDTHPAGRASPFRSWEGLDPHYSSPNAHCSGSTVETDVQAQVRGRWGPGTFSVSTVGCRVAPSTSFVSLFEID